MMRPRSFHYHSHHFAQSVFERDRMLFHMTATKRGSLCQCLCLHLRDCVTLCVCVCNYVSTPQVYVCGGSHSPEK